MKHIRTIEGNLTPNDGKYAIVVGRWNAFVVESLLEGAVDSLTRHGVKQTTSPLSAHQAQLKFRWS